MSTIQDVIDALVGLTREGTIEWSVINHDSEGNACEWHVWVGKHGFGARKDRGDLVLILDEESIHIEDGEDTKELLETLVQTRTGSKQTPPEGTLDDFLRLIADLV